MDCPFCQTEIGSGSLTRHIRGHLQEKPYICKVCTVEYSRLQSLKDHLISKHSINYRVRVKQSHVCSICDRVFRYKHVLVTHQRSHSEVRPYKCTICGKRFKSAVEVSAHTKWTHSKHRSFCCDKCPKTFKYKQSLVRHDSSYHKTKTFKCPLCALRFSTKSRLKIHLIVHTGEEQFKCESCGKRFITKFLLKSHQKSHDPKAISQAVPTAYCTICGKSFTKRNLDLHMNIHKGIKPYVCTVCQKPFRQRPHLTRHMTTHTGEKNYKCRVCGKGFADSTDRGKHEMTHDSSTMIHGCLHCSKVFRCKSALKNHIQRHEKQLSFWCMLCSKGFVGSHELKVHTLWHIHERPHFCFKCGLGYRLKCNLNKHKSSVGH